MTTTEAKREKARPIGDPEAREYADLKRVLRMLERLQNHQARGQHEGEVVRAAFDAALAKANDGAYKFVGSEGGFTFQRR